MIDCRDKKGKLLKVGDKIKCIGEEIHSITTLNKIYKIEKIKPYYSDNFMIYYFNDSYLDWSSSQYIKENFIKVNDNLKIKIRKLKKLINHIS